MEMNNCFNACVIPEFERACQGADEKGSKYDSVLELRPQSVSNLIIYEQTHHKRTSQLTIPLRKLSGDDLIDHLSQRLVVEKKSNHTLNEDISNLRCKYETVSTDYEQAKNDLEQFKMQDSVSREKKFIEQKETYQ